MASPNGRRVLDSAARAELDAVLSSASFRDAPGLSSFLRYVVERSLDGDAEELKEYTIGVEALGRGEAFEPRSDTIVRVQARRLRERLAAHYDKEGRRSQLRIDLPVGGYVPEFRPASSGPALRAWLSGRSAIALAAIGVGVASLTLQDSRRSVPAPEFSPAPLTYYEGLEDEASLSPDGSQIAFTWNGPAGDDFNVYVRTVAAGSPSALTKDPRREFSPSWSPDGAWIAFLRDLGNGRAEVCRIPVSGGREQRLFEMDLPAFRHGGGLSVPDRHLSWSPDSRFLAFVDQNTAVEPAALHVFSFSGNARHPLTSPPAGSIGDRNPVFSPDGSRLAFTGSRSEGLGVYLVELDDEFSPAGEPKFLLEQRGVQRGLSWGRNEQELLVMTEHQLWAVDVRDPESKQRFRFTGPGIDFPAFSREAGRLVYTKKVGAANIWRIDLDGDRSSGPPKKVTSSTRSDVNFQISPDGSQIVFMAFLDGKADIWIAGSDGTHASRLSSRNGGTPRWSPDSDTIVFDSRSPEGDFDIWTIDAQGVTPEPFTLGPADDHSPNWSRDGRWIYFASDRGDGFQLWKKEVAGGREVQVTREGGFYAEESIDGRFVYYTKGRQDWTVWRVAADGGTEISVVDAISTWNNFAVSREGIYYTPQRRADGRSPILFYDFSDASVSEVFAPERPTSNGLSLSPDGRNIFYSQIDNEDSDLMLVEGFR